MNPVWDLILLYDCEDTFSFFGFVVFFLSFSQLNSEKNSCISKGSQSGTIPKAEQ